jgi:UDP-N-acetylglucosamine/UDP-N-acetylgalactosamine diphosphorylase
MTVLLPWVTLGSGLNWCDILVSGGTGSSLGEFSEIGSGCIHFNFTPRGDKATASRLGNVVDGVFLDQPRVFIGGNASLVGPLTAPFGAVTAAGGRFAGTLQAGLNATQPGRAAQGPFDVEVYGSIRRVVESQFAYLGELAALDAWYRHVRGLLATGNADRADLYGRGRAVVQANLRERIAQLEALAGCMPRSAELLHRANPGDPRIGQQRAFHEQWPALKRHAEGWESAITPCPAALSQALERSAAAGSAYTRIIRGLSPAAKDAGRAWLRGIRDRIAAPPALATIPNVSVSG